MWGGLKRGQGWGCGLALVAFLVPAAAAADSPAAAVPFQQVQISPVEADGMALADLDGDGDLDIATTSGPTRTLGWWSNDLGDASAWTWNPYFDLGGSGYPLIRLRTGDIDGDGDPDLAVSKSVVGGGNEFWIANEIQDAGTWGPGDELFHGMAGRYQDLALVDLDRDGDLDFLGVEEAAPQMVWSENLDGLGDASSLQFIEASSGYCLATGDVNADGFPDVVVNDVALDLLVTHAGTEPPTWTTTTLPAPSYGAVHLVDVDADGDLDLLRLEVGQPVPSLRNEDGALGVTSPIFPPPGWYGTGTQLTAADIDGDGDPDSIIGGGGTIGPTVGALENQQGFSGAPFANHIGTDSCSALAVGDLDGDGDPDLACAGTGSPRAPGLSVYLNQTPARPHAQWGVHDAGAADSVTAVYHPGEWTRPRLVRGDGGTLRLSVWDYATGVSSPGELISSVSDTYAALATSDLDRDGTLDVVAAGSSLWLLSPGASGWTQTSLDVTPPPWSRLVACDIDRDGDDDLAGVAPSADLLALYRNDGAGGLTLETIDSAADSPTSVACADLDHDGDPDLLVAAQSAGDVRTYWNDDGSASLWTEESLFAVPGATTAVAADADRDGVLDVAAAGATDLVLALGGAASWSAAVVGPSAGVDVHLQAADIDRDGWTDLYLASSLETTVLHGRSGGFVAAPVAGPSTGPRAARGALADLDLDGDLDVIHPDGPAALSWAETRRAHVWVDVNDVSGWTAHASGGTAPLFRLDVTSLAGATDPALGVTDFGVQWTLNGSPLAVGNDATVPIISDLLLYLDDGDFAFDPTLDSLEGTSSGDMTWISTGGTAPSTAVAPGGTAYYWVVAELAPTAQGAGLASVDVSPIIGYADEYPATWELPSPTIGSSTTARFHSVAGAGELATLHIDQPPVAEAGGPFVGFEGQTTVLDASGSVEPNGGALLYEWDCGYPGATLSPQFGCTFPEQGTYTVTVTVTDGSGSSDTDTALVYVENAPPWVGFSGNTSTGLPEGVPHTGTLVPFDVPADSPWVTGWVALFEGAPIASGTGTQVSFTPPNEGLVTLEATAEDEDGGVGTTSWTFVAVNVPPVPAFSGPATLDEGTPGTWTATAADVPGDPIAWSWLIHADGSGSVLDSGVGATFETTLPDDGGYTLYVTADDGVDLVATTIPVTGTNVSPSFTSTPPATAEAGTPWTYTPTVVDPGLDVFTFSVSGSAPPGLSVNAYTGAIQWTPTSADAPSVAFTLFVSDNDGGTDAQSVSVTVTLPDTDGDGMPDEWEVQFGLDPLTDDSGLDPDWDGGTNLDEYQAGMDPTAFDGPGAPLPLAPIGGAEVATLRPLLEWDPAPDPQNDPLTYDVEIYADAGLTGLLTSAVGYAPPDPDAPTWTSALPLPENETAWWRVRAHDPWVTGSWAPTESFFVNTVEEAPSAPVPTAPLDGDAVDTRFPTFSWSPSSDPDGDAVEYEVLVSDGGGTTTLDAGTTLPFLMATSALAEDGEQTWRVRAVDEHGMTSDWSLPQTFRVDSTNGAPAPVSWLAPTDGAQLEDLAPTLQVSASSDPEASALTYEFHLSEEPTFLAPVSHESPSPTWSLAETGHLTAEHTTLFARARARDEDGAVSAWAGVEAWVRGPNDPPASAALVAPDDGDAFSGWEPVVFVIEHGVDPEGDPVRYRLELTRGDDLVASVDPLGPSAGPAGDDEQTSWATSEVLAPGEYRATVVALDDRGAASEPTERTFTVVRGESPVPVDGPPEGCACSSAGQGGGSTVWALILLAAGRARRRRSPR